jgi:hypothetical protein
MAESERDRNARQLATLSTLPSGWYGEADKVHVIGEQRHHARQFMGS